MIEAVQDYAILLLDTEGRVASWNQGANASMATRQTRSSGALHVLLLPGRTIAAGRRNGALELAARDGRFENEGWQVRKDGSRFWANAIITGAARAETGRSARLRQGHA
jgi:hypothetical protein